jgi:hypothetical protein
VTRRGFHYKHSALILLNHRQRSTGCLQQCRKFGFNESTLLLWIAHVPERWSHVKSAASLTFEKHIVAAQVDFGGLTCGAQLLEMTVAEFSLLVLLIANGLRVCNTLRGGSSCRLRRRCVSRNGFGNGCGHSSIIAFAF